MIVDAEEATYQELKENDYKEYPNLLTHIITARLGYTRAGMRANLKGCRENQPRAIWDLKWIPVADMESRYSGTPQGSNARMEKLSLKNLRDKDFKAIANALKDMAEEEIVGLHYSFFNRLMEFRFNREKLEEMATQGLFDKNEGSSEADAFKLLKSQKFLEGWFSNGLIPRLPDGGLPPLLEWAENVFSNLKLPQTPRDRSFNLELLEWPEAKGSKFKFPE